MYLYYSSANNGTNCVIVTNNYGKTTQVRAELRIKSDGNKKTDSPYQVYWDEGMYASYAGAVFATNTNGRCAGYKGTLWFPGGYTRVSSSWGWCG